MLELSTLTFEVTGRVARITLYKQPVQDLTVDATVSRGQYQFALEDANDALARLRCGALQGAAVLVP